MMGACILGVPVLAQGQTEPAPAPGPGTPVSPPTAMPQSAPHASGPAPAAPPPAPGYGAPYAPAPGHGSPYSPAPGYGTAPYQTPPGYGPPHAPAPGYPVPYSAAPIDPRPRYLPYRVGEPAPPGYIFDEQVRRGPLIGGLITLGVPYLIGLLVASQENYSNKKGYLLVPVLGPWLTLITRDSSCDPTLPISDCIEDSASRFVLVLDGILQTGGAVLASSGIFNTRKRYMLKLEEGPASSALPAAAPPSVTLLPRATKRGFGFDLLGHF